MILTTTHNIEGREIAEYLGIVTGDTILGANIFRDFMAGITDIVGGRARAYEQSLEEAKRTAIREMTENAYAMGADAVVGVDLDFETVGQGGSMLMVSASGTAVRLKRI